MKKEYGIFAGFMVWMAFFTSGCAGMPIYKIIRQQSLGPGGFLLSIMTFLVGCGLIWHCWSQAKEKNRNPWLWAALSFIFGFLPLLFLVYLKKLPEKASNELSGVEDKTP
ncbi:membrane hypothetical protein [Candidatus Desulfarcum epimagneticum]|uniref:DUF2834 domain-containing protein n=1 Tax=uncultured Desulfobacteraceae bacterium TaxID=218296 RepID=A0A484HIW3_9BACT|nr:membrane hypothetical protein [uncultured Desulfobacteraceae bacterium]